MSQLTRRVFCLGTGAAGACGSPVETSDPVLAVPTPSDEDIAAAEADAAVSGEGFAFGPVDDTGISIGLLVENPRLRRGDKLRYDIALRNSGAATVHRWLSIPRHYLMLLMIRRQDGTTEILSSALSGNHTITMFVDAEETRARSGTPLKLDAEGHVELYLMYGGPHYAVEEVSGVVKVEVIP